MSDTFTAALGLILQETGGNTNTWGQNLNDQVIQYIEDKLVGRTAVSTTGGGTTLTQAQTRVRHIDVSGVLSSDATITVPNKKNGWIVNNATTGGFGVIIKTSGGSASCSVPQGTSKHVDCDGADTVQRADRNIVGEFFFHAGSSVPSGAVEADGSAWKRTRAPEAYVALGTTWGAGNGSDDFVFPDLKTTGKFLRSRSGSVALATSQSDQNKAHTHTVSGTGSGTTNSTGSHYHDFTGTTDSNGDHFHSAFNDSGGGPSGGGSLREPGSSNGQTSTNGDHAHNFSGSTDSNSNHSHTVTVSSISATAASDGGTEARPINVSAILCVRI